jgi:hypothetical protein
MLILSIEASLSERDGKPAIIRHLRVTAETIKYLVRVSHDLSVIDQKKYISLEERLIEISKMAAGWEKFITKNPSQGRVL